MRQISNERSKSLRHSVGICQRLGVSTGLCHRLAMTVVAAAIGLASGYGIAQAQDNKALLPNQSGNQSVDQAAIEAQNTSENGAMSREEILALFQREARAAYQMNKQACETLSAEDKKICLARARLQFDADMRYAQKRADQGY